MYINPLRFRIDAKRAACVGGCKFSLSARHGQDPRRGLAAPPPPRAAHRRRP